MKPASAAPTRDDGSAKLRDGGTGELKPSDASIASECVPRGGSCGSGRDNDCDCVDCLTNAECSELPTLSRCQSGSCALCALDDDCELFAAPARGNLEACQEDVGCVQCVTDAHCNDTPNTPHCKLVDTGESAGDAALNTCVQCLDNNDCPSPGASQCVNNQCVACTATAGATDPSCSHIRNGATVLGVCDAGTCVECTGPRRGPCGTDVCNSLTKQCADGVLTNSAALCDTCVSDAQCAPTERCVQLTVGTSSACSCFPLATGTPPACSEQVFFELLLPRRQARASGRS